MCYNYYMVKVNNFPQQTHFIGVLVPDDITLTLEDCRRYMKERYGCRSGFQTPIHVTLVPPFHLNENYTTDDLMRAIENDVVPFANELKFTAHVDNFSSFGERTIFAKVLRDEKWTKLRDKVLGAVLKAAPGCTKKDQRPFTPHLTVANRDIPEGVVMDALKVMNEMELVEDFEVNNVTVFERRDGRWVSAGTLEL